MRILKLVAAAAIAFGTMSALTVPTDSAQAQRHWRGDGHRHHMRHWRGDGHRHWRGNRWGRHCRWVWRHHRRHRVCWR